MERLVLTNETLLDFQISGRLYLFETHRDRVSLPDEQAAASFQVQAADLHGERFEWDSHHAGGFVMPEPGILRFSVDQALVASFGKDRPLRRAKQCHLRRFALAPSPAR